MANNEDIMDVYTRFKEKGFPYYSTDKKWRDEKFNILWALILPNPVI